MGKIKVCGDILVSEPFKEIWRFVGQEIGGVLGDMSLFNSFCLWQFCSLLSNLFRPDPGFVEFDQVLQRLLRMWMDVERQTPEILRLEHG